ncbi:MAG: hypothetical protein OEZ06_06485 [Myxococcales bacterium]|nr:hypothetical protein [Myxococcales bacterium]
MRQNAAAQMAAKLVCHEAGHAAAVVAGALRTRQEGFEVFARDPMQGAGLGIATPVFGARERLGRVVGQPTGLCGDFGHDQAATQVACRDRMRVISGIYA